MAASMVGFSVPVLRRISLTGCSFRVQQVRRIRKPRKMLSHEMARSWADRLAEIHKKDPELDRDINIGFKMEDPISQERLKLEEKKWKRSRHALEKSARDHMLVLDPDQVDQEWLMTQSWTKTVHNVAEHFGIFKDLFDNAFFYPNVHLNVSYECEEDYVTSVCFGNKIPAEEVIKPPVVNYLSDPDTYWTLVMTAPDSHLQKGDSEYLHWFIGNIKGSDLSSGEVLCDYLPPIPVRGTGWHRMVFILYKQEKQLDFTPEKRTANCISLAERTFQNLEFYRKHQDDITPAGLAFYQTEWDDSITSTFWDILDMKEPSFEFMHPPPYHPKQKPVPHKQPLNLYLDRYRDIKDLNEEVVREKLRTANPFRPREVIKYPMAVPFFTRHPSWYKFKLQHQRLRIFHWKDLDD